MAKSRAVQLLIISAGFVSLPSLPIADACVMRNIAEDPLHIALAEQFRGSVVCIKVLVPEVGVGYRYASAVALNERWGLTAYHVVRDLVQYNPTYEISDGLNYLTSRGRTVPVARILPWPGLTPSSNLEVNPDIALIEFAQPLSGVVSRPISSASATGVLSAAGFGRRGSPAAGDLGKDGNARAWKATATSSNLYSWYSSAWYQEADMGPTGSYQQLFGQGMSGDSGGPWFNAVGELTGITIYGTNGTQGGLTGFLKLNTPAIRDWIVANTALPVCLADVAGVNQASSPDGSLTADDIIVYLSWYFASDLRADVAGQNQSSTADGAFTADDIIVFLSRYFQGC